MHRRSLLLSAAGLLAACSTSAPPPPAPLAPPGPPRQPRIGIALGGGGTKGFAHVGVIKALEAQGLRPELIAGTSAGSVVGALYASGLDGFALQELAFGLDESKVKDFNLRSPWEGLVIGQKLQDYVNQLVKNRTIDQLSKPFVAVATQGDTGQRVDFARGNTGQAVRASSSFPVFFKPTQILGKTYVDGCLVSPVPVDAARKMGADIVIGVDISAQLERRLVFDGLSNVIDQSLVIMIRRLGEQELARADVVIRPKVGKIGVTDFDQKDKAILEGEKAVALALADVRLAIQKWQLSHP
ncbi:patatin-like phospholipase family protein [Rhodoferax fermentans]|uniref:Patatin n=2 Tax=Rhodoferax fermentans TaxID=28066 RepID=A0A1T1AQ14_RHOFE|nr:patatin-like phospholipase family protein [Rhodoferax fermentans]OOV06179.1 Patatin [Rhodoferax fermentans]